MSQSRSIPPRTGAAGPGSGRRRAGRLPAALALLAALAAAVFSVAPGRAAADVFTVEGVPLDATAATAARARDQALPAGQVAAFGRLMDRLVLSADRARVPALGYEAVSELVRDLELADERTSAVRYLARLTVRFRADAVRNFLRERGLIFAETRSKPLLVLPVLETAGALALWDDPNPWRAAWKQVPPSDGLVPLVLPEGDLQDVAAIGAEQAVRGDDRPLQAVARRYGAADVLTARAAMRFPESQVAEGGTGPWLQVTLTRFGTVQLEQTRVESFFPEEGEGMDALLARAAVSVARQIEEGWKRNNRLRFDIGDELAVEVPLRSLDEWLEIRSRLESIAFVRRSDLVVLTRRAAVLRLNFIGDEEQLRLALAQNDLTLEPGATAWVLRMRAGGGRNGNSPAGTP